MSEYSVGHVEPPVGAPGESIQQFMPVIQSEPIEQNGPAIGDIVVVRILEKQELRRLAHVCAPVAEQNPGGEIEAVGKYSDLIRAPVIVRVLEDFDSISRPGSRRGAERIFVELDDP